ncbi:MAG: hypothetical protein HND49_04065 [Planctomycetes bacterium]|nr:hypothetical protein [Planctomycetota bacterium]
MKSIYSTISICITLPILLLSAFFVLSHVTMRQEYLLEYDTKAEVALRKFPYPYRAALSICSDIDNTETLEEFLAINTFLNTTEMTSMGRGVGLDIGNSFFFFAPRSEAISYFNSPPEVAECIRKYIKSEQIDTLHSYGEKEDFTRANAVSSIKELKDSDLKIDVWVDHTRTPDNFGDDVTFGTGDQPDTKTYHADLTVDYGIKFVWLGRITTITGQSVPITSRSFTGIYDPDHPIESVRNIVKEFGKHVLAVFGNDKYEMHRKNDLVKISTLDDGQKVYEFMRFDNFWRGVAEGGNSKNLAYTISKKTLEKLKGNGGFMVVYTHLGQRNNPPEYIPKETQAALRNLAEEFRRGDIYITTTSKLLNYCVNHRYLKWSYETKDGETIITIEKIDDPVSGSYIPSLQQLRGITFYVPDTETTRIFVNNGEVTKVKKKWT